jgi:hypothetical protein
MSEEIDFEEVDDVLNENEDFLEEQIDNENYDEVLALTEYDGGGLLSESNAVVAEYDNIDIIKIELRHKNEAKSFVQKITKFVTNFNDADLTDEHIKYLKQVGAFQLEHLSDLLSLVTINKQMINNIVRRVNSVQAEDFAMIATYNSLLNQHLKLMKELQNTYKAIPGVLKKMKTEVICNQELLDGENSNEVISDKYGETQFNDQKQLLKKLKEGYNEKNNQ